MVLFEFRNSIRRRSQFASRFLIHNNLGVQVLSHVSYSTLSIPYLSKNDPSRWWPFRTDGEFDMHEAGTSSPFLPSLRPLAVGEDVSVNLTSISLFPLVMVSSTLQNRTETPQPRQTKIRLRQTDRRSISQCEPIPAYPSGSLVSPCLGRDRPSVGVSRRVLCGTLYSGPHQPAWLTLGHPARP